MFFCLTWIAFFGTVPGLRNDTKECKMQYSAGGTPEVQGIGLVLYDEYGRLFFVTEGVEKSQYDKRVGDLSIPWETREVYADGSLESDEIALQRVLREEVGFGVLISPAILLLEFKLFGVIPQKIYLAECYGASRFGGEAIVTGELLGWEWAHQSDIRSHRVRGGMQKILEAYRYRIAVSHRERIVVR